jgi:hypothetical protein
MFPAHRLKTLWLKVFTELCEAWLSCLVKTKNEQLKIRIRSRIALIKLNNSIKQRNKAKFVLVLRFPY